jgi:hypothetical protein
VPESKKKKARRAASKPAHGALDPLRPGMPAKDSIRKVVAFISPQNVRYKILKTTETDAYDPVSTPPKKRGSKS